MGTIKINDDKIITKKDGITEIWSKYSGDTHKFIVYNGVVFKLKEISKEY